MTWIKTVAYEDATGRLKMLYDRIKGPDNNVDNIMMSHSLRPHSMDGHMTLYKYVLHHTGNTVPKWFLEAIGGLVSHLNGCAYCFDHHLTGMARLLKDEAKSAAIRSAITSGDFASVFDSREVAALTYARKLTVDPAAMIEQDVLPLRAVGWEDGEILEINQVTAYFAYANRTVLGLGVSTQGDIIGLSPNNSDNPDDWSHT
ncbi:MAG: carboxymuconolactone decarboxylase family protein [Tropicimonas sp.]|uniref:carboxymuconolactone decarboxylase family protein n=1 Tax=Tropicimonas sp. TaxID=2067044 RepID=UPI003A8A9F0B